MEILVVIFILGIILGTALLTIGISPQRQLQIEVDRLTALINLAKEQAIIRSEQLALSIEPHQYQFLYLAKDQWKPLTANNFQPHLLPEDIELSLNSNDYPTNLPITKETEYQPHIIFFSSSEITPFTLELHSVDWGYQISGQINGTLTTTVLP